MTFIDHGQSYTYFAAVLHGKCFMYRAEIREACRIWEAIRIAKEHVGHNHTGLGVHPQLRYFWGPSGDYDHFRINTNGSAWHHRGE